jgi:chromosomal replication initiation ATPase DnaA
MTGVLPESKMVPPKGQTMPDGRPSHGTQLFDYLRNPQSEQFDVEAAMRRVVRDELRAIQAERKLPAKRYAPTCALCIDLTALIFGVEREAILSKDRGSEINRVRHAAMWLARKVTSQSYSEIGIRFGRDHSSIVHGAVVIEKLRGTDPGLDDALDRLMAYFKATY